jgi:hypothetical protein
MNNMKPSDNYMLLFRSATWYADLPEGKAQEIIADWMAWYDRLVKEGIVESGRPLAPGGKIVGKDAISDGPFTESKETVGGYFLLNVATLDEAVAIAKECPGVPYGVRVEVRQMLERCPVDKAGDTVGRLTAAHA